MADTNFCCKVVASQQKMSGEWYKMTVTDLSAGLTYWYVKAVKKAEVSGGQSRQGISSHSNCIAFSVVYHTMINSLIKWWRELIEKTIQKTGHVN